MKRKYLPIFLIFFFLGLITVCRVEVLAGDVLAFNDESSHAEIASDSLLDPIVGRNFYVIVEAYIDRLPSEGHRLNVISKHHTTKLPYSGWGISLKRINGRIRPQVYWKGGNGKGGWYSFASINLKPHQWFWFFIAIEPSKALYLYGSGGKISYDIEDAQVPFFGAYQINDVLPPASRNSMVLGSRSKGKLSYSGLISNVSIINSKKKKQGRFITISFIKDLLDSESLNDDVVFLLRDGFDRSRFARDIHLKGRAEWIPDLNTFLKIKK